MTVLDDILVGVRADLAERKQRTSLGELRRQIDAAPPARDSLPGFRADGLSLIAEVKRASPSKGALADIPDPASLAAAYEQGGADAISVLTEAHRFHGGLADLDAVRARVNLPVLRKDFMVEEYQLVESRAHGADLCLLIVAALDDEALPRLYRTALDLGLTPLVEVHTPDETRRAADLGAALIGVNNRNLTTLEVDVHQFGRLVGLIPAGVVKVAESGLLAASDVALVRSQGADVVLMGEALVRTAHPLDAVRDLKALGRATPVGAGER